MASDRVDMSVGKGMVNGGYGSNGVPQSEPQKGGSVNGEIKAAKAQPTHQDGEALSLDQVRPYANGVDNLPHNTMKQQSEKMRSIEQLPQELLEMLNQIPLEAFIPMAHLINRSTQTCWADLHHLIDRLSSIRLQPPKAEQDRLPNGNVNDTTIQNREKKLVIWEFAKRHKDVFVKLLVLLQSGKSMDDIRKTIALNFFLHERRHAFNSATISLGNMVRDLSAAQIPNPDLATAAEVLATGRVSSFPELEQYSPQETLTPKQILAILRRLNTVLCTRMALQENIPAQMNQWQVHDGRVTFVVPHEFDLDLSLVDEKPDANFGMVDVRFKFSPAPSISEAMHAELQYLINTEMEKGGLAGAYDFLHELTLSYKLKELHRQALILAQGQWAGHLRVELHKRILVIQYWLKRGSSKSWLEIGVHSGQHENQTMGALSPISSLVLKWSREGKVVDEHDIMLDTDNLAVESVLNQAIAQQINYTFNGIFDKTMTIPLYRDAEMSLDQSCSFTEPHDCHIDIQASLSDDLTTSIEPISGSFVLAPVSERISRLQYELSRSKNVVEEFSAKFIAVRCAIAESRLLRCIMYSCWNSLPGLKLSFNEIKEYFGTNAYRACFFRQASWHPSWMLAASFGSGGDFWWLVHQSEDTSKMIVQHLETPPLHSEKSLSRAYFERLGEYTVSIIALQCNSQDLRSRNIRSVLPSYPEFSNLEKTPTLLAELNHSVKLSTLKSTLTLRAQRSESMSNTVTLVVTGHFSATTEVLRRLAATDLGPSTKIAPEQRRLSIAFNTGVGESIVDEMLLKLRRVDDFVSCVSLVYRSKTWELQSCSMQGIELVYDKGNSANLSLSISLGADNRQISATLLPVESNPHALVSPHVSQLLLQGNDSLSIRLGRLLSILHMSLPLVRCLQNLQNNKSGTETTETEKEDLTDLLRIHVMARDMCRFGVHFFSVKDGFKRDDPDGETPKKMLARFEIEPQPGKDGALLTWVLRPAVEEYKTYVRPSFAAKSLSERIKKEVFANTQGKGWLGLDTAAKCKTEDPQPLLTAVHQTVLEWLKDASKEDNKPAATASNGVKQSNNNSQSGSKPTKAGGQANNSKAGGTGQSSRVMTAAPQQVRNAQNNQRQQQGGAQQKNAKSNIKKEAEVIALD